ncbi:MAG TPA: hypothetical protein VG602_09975 [Actinomycetota bacterium]|nr:hypothetical protein [Actinomycetota bacterium]
MSTTATQLRAPSNQAYLILRTGFTVAPILFGLDKFFNVMVFWPKYLAPWINGLMPGDAQAFMYFVGVVEVVAGLTVLVRPWLGSLLVAGWLGAIIVNLLTFNPPQYYDIALRDFGLFLGALTLNRLSTAATTSRGQTHVERPTLAA